MRLRWTPSKEQFTETHDGLWKIRPRYWGRVRAAEYALTKRAQHVGLFPTQTAAKEKADELHSANTQGVARAAQNNTNE